MKKIVDQLLHFITYPNNWQYILLVMALLSALVYCNYNSGLQQVLYSKFNRKPVMVLIHFALYFGVFAGAYFIYSLFNKDFSYWQDPFFILVLFTAPLLFAYQQYFYQHRVWAEANFTSREALVFGISAEWLLRSVMLIGFCVLIAVGKKQKLYGLQPCGGHISFAPYFMMLLIMLPVIVIAASQASFQHAYPKLQAALHLNENKLRSGILFETSYSINFIAIEFFFRGLLVIAMGQVTNKAAIVPMAAFYCTIHFGKPLMECVSSFFGGILLGVVAYYSQSIIGGVIVHLGIAWMMEIAGLYFLLRK
jgi:hypothetical protein